MTVSAIVLPLEQSLPQRFECPRVGPGREIELVTWCYYNDMFNPGFVQSLITEERFHQIRRHKPSAGFGTGWHSKNFRAHYPNLHRFLSHQNPRIIAVMEIPTANSRYNNVDLGIPGGKADTVDELYEPELAILREVEEETCLKVNVDYDYQLSLRRKYNLDYPYQVSHQERGTTYITYIIIY